MKRFGEDVHPVDKLGQDRSINYFLMPNSKVISLFSLFGLIEYGKGNEKGE